MNVDGRVKVVDGWKRERARSRLRGLTVLIPSPESGRVDLAQAEFRYGNGNSDRYDLSRARRVILSGGRYDLLAQLRAWLLYPAQLLRDCEWHLVYISLPLQLQFLSISDPILYVCWHVDQATD